jgi:hypothetical protein
MNISMDDWGIGEAPELRRTESIDTNRCYKTMTNSDVDKMRSDAIAEFKDSLACPLAVAEGEGAFLLP